MHLVILRTVTHQLVDMATAPDRNSFKKSSTAGSTGGLIGMLLLEAGLGPFKGLIKVNYFWVLGVLFLDCSAYVCVFVFFVVRFCVFYCFGHNKRITQLRCYSYISCKLHRFHLNLSYRIIDIWARGSRPGPGHLWVPPHRRLPQKDNRDHF